MCWWPSNKLEHLQSRFVTVIKLFILYNCLLIIRITFFILIFFFFHYFWQLLIFFCSVLSFFISIIFFNRGIYQYPEETIINIINKYYVCVSQRVCTCFSLSSKHQRIIINVKTSYHYDISSWYINSISLHNYNSTFPINK